MNPLSRHLEEYLALRRRLGFELRDAGSELHKFLRFAQQAKASFVATKLALEWATQPTGCQPAQWTTRLGMVRRFAEYLSAVDPRTEIPPTGLLPHRYHRKSPYFYRDQEVAQLIQAAQKIPSPKGLRAATYSTLFGVLAVTGMRLGEAIGLDRRDVDLDQGLLKVRQAKFNKSRWVPIHLTTRARLQRYQRSARPYLPSSPKPKLPAFGARHSLDRLDRAPLVHPLIPSNRIAPANRSPRPAHSRSTAPLCHSNPAPLVPNQQGR